MAVPNTFATDTTPIPLSQLDANFAYFDAAMSIIGANITFPGTLTLSGGTANGVAYLNGSKVLTTGSALTFDGTKLKSAGFSNGATLRVLEIANDGAGVNTKSQLAFTVNNTAYGYINGGYGASSPAMNFQLPSGTPGVFTWGTSGSAEDMRLTSTGLGIGTSSPGAKLQIGAGSGTGVKETVYIGSYSTDTSQFRWLWNHAGTGLLGIGTANDASGSMIFGRANDATGAVGAEWMRLDTSGNLGLGVTPSAWGGALVKAVELTSAALTSYSTGGAYAGYLASNAYYNGTNWIYKQSAPAVQYAFEGTNGAHKWFNAPSGTAGNAISFTQAMTLDASGNLLVANTSASGTPTVGFCLLRDFSAASASGIAIGHQSGTGGGAVYANFAYNGAAIGSITQSGTAAVLYNVTSDQRLKENIQDADSASALIDSLQVRKYDWKADGSHQRYGFVAQELVTVAPEAVHQPADPEEMMAVDYSKLVPMLVKEVQSLRARVAQLESN